ncbi:MAG: hypothetical protein AAF922_16965 [Pseudomonadota bacterium]
MGVWTRIQEFFEPQPGWPLKTLNQFKRQRQIQALWIGILAFFLPIVLFFGNQSSACFRDSISHSYYIPFWGDVFVATTCSVGLFLLFYRGQSCPERALALAGGFFAIMVALNPTNGTGCEEMIAQSRIFHLDPSDDTLASAYPYKTTTGKIHLWSAILLFIVLAIFNLFVFTATDKTSKLQTNPKNHNKVIRNWIYRICGGLMIANLIALAVGFGFKSCDAFHPDDGLFQPGLFCSDDHRFESLSWDRNNLTFYFEWLGLALFGIAWFVKGRGGGFLLTDEFPNQIISKPWWWPVKLGCRIQGSE